MPPKRFTANPLAAPRYRAGKPLPTVDASSSESESDSDSDGSPTTAATTATKPTRPTAPPKAASFPGKIITTDVKAREAQIAAERAREAAAERRKREEEGGEGDEEGFVTASDTDEGEGESEEEEEDDEEEDDYSSDSDAGPRRFVAPVFVKKKKGADGAPGATAAAAAAATMNDEAERDERLRRQKADEMLQAQLERQARERAEGKKAWDDDDGGGGGGGEGEGGAGEGDVDDRDGLDPEAELAAWRLRELRRVKREREAIERSERERAEVERRRNLSREEREREDAEHIGRQREEKEGRGKMGFMQRYFHKGAFFQADDDDGGDNEGEGGGEDEAVKAAKRREVAGRTFQDDAVNRELLPQYMQIRDMSKLGKKSRTRYKDLKSEDTGRFGADLHDGKGRGDAGGRYDGPSGANGVAVGERRPRDDDRDGRDQKRPRYDR